MKNIKNKKASLAIIAIGIITTLLSKDATYLTWALIVGIPLFFAKQNWIG